MQYPRFPGALARYRRSPVSRLAWRFTANRFRRNQSLWQSPKQKLSHMIRSGKIRSPYLRRKLESSLNVSKEALWLSYKYNAPSQPLVNGLNLIWATTGNDNLSDSFVPMPVYPIEVDYPGSVTLYGILLTVTAGGGTIGHRVIYYDYIDLSFTIERTLSAPNNGFSCANHRLLLVQSRSTNVTLATLNFQLTGSAVNPIGIPLDLKDFVVLYDEVLSLNTGWTPDVANPPQGSYLVSADRNRFFRFKIPFKYRAQYPPTTPEFGTHDPKWEPPLNMFFVIVTQDGFDFFEVANLYLRYFYHTSQW